MTTDKDALLREAEDAIGVLCDQFRGGTASEYFQELRARITAALAGQDEKGNADVRLPVYPEQCAPSAPAPQDDCVRVPRAEIEVLGAIARAGLMNARVNFPNLAGDFDAIQMRLSALLAAAKE